ncbi:MAG: glycosyltransferase family 4 protein [Dehalococcoidales bacterium]
MKILMQQWAYFPWIGGAEIFTQHLAEHMISRGHQVDIVTALLSKPSIEYDNWQQETDVINGVNVYRVRVPGVKYAGIIAGTLRLYTRSLKLDQQNDYDIIHSHIFPAMVCGALSKRKKKLLITLQGGDIGEYKESGWFIRTAETPFIRWSLKKADLVHCVSTHIAKAAKKLGAGEVNIVPNGVDTAIFRPGDKYQLRKKLGYGLKDKIVVSTSRLTPKNGLDYLIKALAPLGNVKLIIIGEGEQRKNLESMIQDLKLSNRVFLPGALPHQELPQYLAIADAFCRPSVNEGFGISFIESMACRIPTIGTAVGGITDIINHGENGILVPPEDTRALSRVLKRVIEDDGLAKKIAEKGFQTVKQKFTWEKVLQQMENVYQGLSS